MFDRDFEHYLTYGATDQQTVRRLAGAFTGLLIPGTVAAFQRQGTGGFVLSLSATEEQIPYVIDPRFPLFQQPLPHPKKSHEALANVFGEPGLVSSQGPQASAFSDELIDKIARQWVTFNETYRDSVGAKFDKYAKRLKEEVAPENAREPRYVLAPYTMAEGLDDPWWKISTALFDRTLAHLQDPNRCVRVIAAKETRFLRELLQAEGPARAAIWVSGLDELVLPVSVLRDYADSVRVAVERGKRLFALYGGFFSVLLASVGLGGSCHGIGYGEYRDWLELPQSGPPPARYYLPRLHRYVSVEHVLQLWFADASLASCSCDVCEEQPPVDLDYHSLMMHSVWCRAREIEEWSGTSTTQIATRLRQEQDEFLSLLSRSRASELVKREATRNAQHLYIWISVFDAL